MRFLLLSPRPSLYPSKGKSREVLQGHEVARLVRSCVPATRCREERSTDGRREGTRSVVQYRRLRAFVFKPARQTALTASLPAASADAKNGKAHRIHQAWPPPARVESGQSPAAWTAFRWSNRNKVTTAANPLPLFSRNSDAKYYLIFFFK